MGLGCLWLAQMKNEEEPKKKETSQNGGGAGRHVWQIRWAWHICLGRRPIIQFFTILLGFVNFRVSVLWLQRRLSIILFFVFIFLKQ